MNKELEKQVKKCKEVQLWDKANKVLYDLCKKYPNHETREDIIAKAMIIGRTYAASLERQKKEGSKIETTDFYTKVYKALHNKSFSNKIEQLKYERSITKDNLVEVVKLHKKMVNLLEKCTKEGISNRSFASKYLHFHLPKLFYIFDKYANTEIKKLRSEISWKGNGECLLDSLRESDFDSDYGRFVNNCFHVHRYLKQNKYSLKPRQLDNLLSERRRKSLKKRTPTR